MTGSGGPAPRGVPGEDTDVDGPDVLSRADAIALLRTRAMGRLVYTNQALPAVMPVNFALRDGGIWLWTGSAAALGRPLDQAVVAFQVDELDLEACSGWSVTVTGMAHLVTDDATLDRARAEGPAPWTPDTGGHLIRIPLTLVTGRMLGALGPTSTAKDRLSDAGAHT